MAHPTFGTTSRTYNAFEAGNSRFASASGGGGSGATAAEIELAIGENFVVGSSSIDARALVAKAVSGTGSLALFEIDGTTAVADGSVFVPAGSSQVSVIPTPVADLVEGNRYTGTLATGAHNRAAILALTGGTHVVAMDLTVISGTGVFVQTGNINPLVAGDTLEFEYINGVSLPDFTITVDASSEVIITVLSL